MTVRTSAWPIEALPFEEILTPVVESFLDIEERGAFDRSRSAIKQLYDRVDESGPIPRKNALLALIRNQLGEFDCLAICNSGFSDPLLLPETTCGKPLGEDIVLLSTTRRAASYLGRFRSILQGVNYD
jgi:hypothetical protein